MSVHTGAVPSPIESLIMASPANRTWIFVSHASADLEPVREVRNYLERKDASPLLFHLRALKHEDEFWPVIEREIAERDFFLLCESEAADQSEWVKRERAAVERATMHRSKRIGSIRVDGGELDFTQLDRFIGTMRVFPSYSRQDRQHVLRFLVALEARGFEVFDDFRDLRAGDLLAEQISSALSGAAAYGFVLIFLSGHSLRSGWVQRETEQALRLNARLIPVLLERSLDLSAIPSPLQSFQPFDATLEPQSAPQRLADLLFGQAI